MLTALVFALILTLVVGLLLWAINEYVPMEPRVKQLLNIFVILGLIVYFALVLLGWLEPGFP